MRVMSEKVSGQRTCRCCICGDTVRHSRTGRPRLICRKNACELARHNQLRRVYERKTVQWTEADAKEAARVWRHRCAYCDQLSTSAFTILGQAPLPVCIEHQAFGPLVGTTDERCRRIQLWLSECHPGCPLPNPWKGAK